MLKGMPERLRELRLEKGYSQKIVAERIRTTQAEICRYEMGDKTPSLSRFIEFSYVYRCSLDYLAGRDVKKNPWDDEDDKTIGEITGKH